MISLRETWKNSNNKETDKRAITRKLTFNPTFLSFLESFACKMPLNVMFKPFKGYISKMWLHIIVTVHFSVALCFYLFSSLSQIKPTFPNVCGYASWRFIHQIKPVTSNFYYLKYEPDLSIHTREKWGVKRTMNFWTPCISN